MQPLLPYCGNRSVASCSCSCVAPFQFLEQIWWNLPHRCLREAGKLLFNKLRTPVQRVVRKVLARKVLARTAGASNLAILRRALSSLAILRRAHRTAACRRSTRY